MAFLSLDSELPPLLFRGGFVHVLQNGGEQCTLEKSPNCNSISGLAPWIPEHKAAYTVNETLDLLSIGRTSLYAAVKEGDLHPVKFGRKTLFYAQDLAVFLKLLKDKRS